jgi:hypothetical protein
MNYRGAGTIVIYKCLKETKNNIEKIFIKKTIYIKMSNTYLFNNQELKLINDFNKAEILKKVYYHFFVNLALPEKKLIMIDTVELVFDDDKTLFLKINEEETGYEITTKNNFESEKQEIEKNHPNVLSFSRIDVTEATIWKDKVNRPLINISPEIDTDFWGGNYLIFHFPMGSLEINYDREKGIIVELYEVD